jgi:hypothetical protein
MRSLFFLFFGLIFFTTNAQLPKNLVKQLTGTFTNQDQIDALPDSVNKTFTANKPWINKLVVSHTLVPCKTIKGQVIYLEWREGSASGKISRQRLWVFTTNEKQQPIMQFYSFKNPAKFVNVSQLDTINTNDLVAYPTTCNLRITKTKAGFAALLDSNTCQIITQQSGKQMKLFALIEVTKKGFTYQEKGIFDNGITAFKVPGFDKYLFRKIN